MLQRGTKRLRKAYTPGEKNFTSSAEIYPKQNSAEKDYCTNTPQMLSNKNTHDKKYRYSCAMTRSVKSLYASQKSQERQHASWSITDMLVFRRLQSAEYRRESEHQKDLYWVYHLIPLKNKDTTRNLCMQTKKQIDINKYTYAKYARERQRIKKESLDNLHCYTILHIYRTFTTSCTYVSPLLTNDGLLYADSSGETT